MSMASRSRSALVAVLFVLSATACGSSSKPSTSSTTSTVPGSARPALSGPLNVFAASSLTEAFKTEQTNLSTSNSGLSLTFNFAGSQALVTQIQQGADVDVFASADTKNMKKLEDAGLVDPPRTFARNRLEIA
ncbi:MAG: molybdate transport system substrate-binding protein, partial [Actinomycetota bacterium]|nr:molybdate transport system substrate-binding protein [Actinomycetota bacterium]